MECGELFVLMVRTLHGVRRMLKWPVGPLATAEP